MINHYFLWKCSLTTFLRNDLLQRPGIFGVGSEQTWGHPQRLRVYDEEKALSESLGCQESLHGAPSTGMPSTAPGDAMTAGLGATFG